MRYAFIIRGLNDMYLVRRTRATWNSSFTCTALRVLRAIPITFNGVETSVTPFDDRRRSDY